LSCHGIEHLSAHELLHTYVLERFGRSGSLSYRDLKTVQMWLELAGGEADPVLLVLEELQLEGLSYPSLAAVSRVVTRRLSETLHLQARPTG
jgi:hypothetical protein